MSKMKYDEDQGYNRHVIVVQRCNMENRDDDIIYKYPYSESNFDQTKQLESSRDTVQFSFDLSPSGISVNVNGEPFPFKNDENDVVERLSERIDHGYHSKYKRNVCYTKR